MLLWNSKSFSQVAIPTAEGTIYEDSLICFPIRYTKFIKEDLINGDRYKKKTEELTQTLNQKEAENISLKQKINQLTIDKEPSNSCQDSLEMKNAKIGYLYHQLGRSKTQNKLLVGLAAVLGVLFTIK